MESNFKMRKIEVKENIVQTSTHQTCLSFPLLLPRVKFFVCFIIFMFDNIYSNQRE